MRIGRSSLRRLNNFAITLVILGLRNLMVIPPELWNHYDTVFNDGVATNNKLESFN